MTSVTGSPRMLIVVLMAIWPVAATAGPSFNSYRDELQKDSREAGRLLQEGFALYHGMLGAIEANDLQAANETKAKAVERYAAAIEQLSKLVERTPKQPLVFSKDDKVQAEAVGRLKAKLTARKLGFPVTERDLAELAVKSVTELRSALLEAELSVDNKSLPGLMRLTLQTTYVEEIGIFTSIIWAGQTGK